MRLNIVRKLFLIYCYTLQFLVAQSSIQLKELSHIPLPAYMNEVSGLSWDGNVLWCVHDEKGWIYTMDTSCSHIDSVQVMTKGDLEDLVWQKDTLFILKSNGKVYFWQKKMKNATLLGQVPDISIDVEGLTYDRNQQRLLLACKSARQNDDPQCRDILMMHPRTGMIDSTLTIHIHASAIEKYCTASPPPNTEIMWSNYFISKKGNWKWAPSAIAIQPGTNLWWILSAKSNTILVYDSVQQKIQDIIFLIKEKHPQAEGMLFTPDGLLWISDESVGGASPWITLYQVK